MRWIRFVLYTVLIIFMSLMGALLAVRNPQTVPLDLLFITFKPKSIALWLLVAIGIGAIIGMAISAILNIRLQSRLVRIRRELSTARAEIDQLRRSGLKNDE